MTTILSTPTMVTVSDLSYPVPSTRSALMIGTNNAASVRPPVDATVYEWSYATMENYGSGAFVRDFSSLGAFVVAGSGGHRGPGIYGALIFNFETAAWTFQANTNGMPDRLQSTTGAELTPIGEIAIAGVSGPMPGPGHLYRLPIGLSGSDGGGARGSLLLPASLVCDDNASINTDYAYRFDLATSYWSRVTTNRRTEAYNHGSYLESTSSYDPVTRRVYVLPSAIAGFAAINYIDLTSGTWKSIPRNGSDLNGTDQTSTFIDADRRLIMMKGSDGQLYAIDLNTGNGPNPLPLSGTLPTHRNRWEYYPVDGSYYSYAGDGSQSIDKLAPPSSAGEPWIASKVPISGATLPPRANMTGAGNAHYTRFFYVPGLQCFAWVADVTSQVALIKP